VVKVLGPDQHLGGVEAWEGAGRLELAALAAGVPMPRPCLVPGTGAGVAAIAGSGSDSVLVHVHEWVDGSISTAPAPIGLAAELGGALATLHRVGFECGQDAEVDPWYRAAHGAVHWRGLADRGDRARRGWPRRLRATVPMLAEVEALVAARAAQSLSLLVCHSDLVPGNVLVSGEGRPWILDWDDAGPWNAAEEVAAAVVSWSTGPQGEPRERVALALVEGYRRAGGILESGSPTVLAGSLSAVVNWLELNVRRSLDDAAEGRDPQQAEAEIAGALGELAWRLARLDRWIDLLR
jgi:Ser/Thr protein kinase RdoA (MazF antagonist)